MTSNKFNHYTLGVAENEKSSNSFLSKTFKKNKKVENDDFRLFGQELLVSKGLGAEKKELDVIVQPIPFKPRAKGRFSKLGESLCCFPSRICARTMSRMNPIYLSDQILSFMEKPVNLKQGSFDGTDRIFNLTYKKGKKTEFPPGSGVFVKIPDQFEASTVFSYQSNEDESFYETKEQLEQEYAASMSLKYSAFLFKDAASEDMVFKSSGFDQNSVFVSRRFQQAKLLQLTRIDERISTFTADFAYAVKSLPTNITTQANVDKYTAFFEKYGTHYVTDAHLGGYIMMETTISKSSLNSSNASKIRSAIDKEFKAGLKKYKANASFGSVKSKYFKRNSDSISRTFVSKGGNSTDGKQAWIESMYDTPTLLLGVPGGRKLISSTLNLISEAARNVGALETIARNLERLISVFAAVEGGVLKLFPENPYSDQLYSNYNINQVYDAAKLGEGFLIIKNEVDKKKGCVLCVRGDKGWSNIEDAMYTSARQEDNLLEQKLDTLTVPILQNESFLVGRETGDMNTNGSLKFIPYNRNLTSEYPAMVTRYPSTSLEHMKIITADFDGFFIMNVSPNGNDLCQTSAYIYDMNIGALASGCSIYTTDEANAKVDKRSCIVPVKKGQELRMIINHRKAKASVEGFFAPFSHPYLKLGKNEKFSPNEIYEAPSDGFISVQLNGPNSENASYENGFTVYMDHDQNKVKTRNEAVKVGGGGITVSSTDYVVMPVSSTLLPVSKGMHYVADLTNKENKVEMNCIFYPMELSIKW